MRWYSSNGRESTITSCFSACSAFSSAGGDARRRVVVLDELAERFDGTLTPLNSSKPAAFHAAQPPSQHRDVRVAELAQLRRRLSPPGLLAAAVEHHDRRALARHQVAR